MLNTAEGMAAVIADLAARVAELERGDPLNPGYPALSGMSAGQVLRATGAANAAFGKVDLLDADAFDSTSIPTMGGLNLGSATGAGAGQLNLSGSISQAITDAGTTSLVVGISMEHRSSGTPAAGFGVDARWSLDSDNNTERFAGLIRTEWATAADATRKARMSLLAYDTAAREGIRIEASGTVPMIGFLGAAAVARAAAYTQTYATATRTHANPTATTPTAYAAGANGYSTAAKAQEMRDLIAALVVDVANIKQVLNSVIDDSQANGLAA